MNLAELQKAVAEVKIVKINVEEERELTKEYNIDAIPTIIFRYRTHNALACNGSIDIKDLVKMMQGYMKEVDHQIAIEDQLVIKCNDDNYDSIMAQNDLLGIVSAGRVARHIGGATLVDHRLPV